MYVDACFQFAPARYSKMRTSLADSFVEGIRILHCLAPETKVIESPTIKPEPDINVTPFVWPPSIFVS